MEDEDRIKPQSGPNGKAGWTPSRHQAKAARSSRRCRIVRTGRLPTAQSQPRGSARSAAPTGRKACLSNPGPRDTIPYGPPRPGLDFVRAGAWQAICGNFSAMFVLTMSLFAEPIKKARREPTGFGRVYSRLTLRGRSGRITQPEAKVSHLMESGLSKNASPRHCGGDLPPWAFCRPVFCRTGTVAARQRLPVLERSCPPAPNNAIDSLS